MRVDSTYADFPQMADMRKLLEPMQGGPPTIIEILGTPNAGKTMALRKLENLLARSGGCRVSTIYETASLCPIKTKLDPAYCEWIACETMQRLLEHMDQGIELILCERGLVDVLCWKRFYLNDARISQERYDASLQYILESAVFAAQRFSVVFTCEPAAAVSREYTGAFRALAGGQVVNTEALGRYNQAIADVLADHRDLLPRYAALDTTNQIPEETARALIMAVVGFLGSMHEKRQAALQAPLPCGGAEDAGSLDKTLRQVLIETATRSFLGNPAKK